MLEVQELKKSYSGREVVRSISFKVEPGETLGLLGPNGAGKTTAFYMTVGLIKPDFGKVYFRGKDVTLLPMHQRAEMGLGYLSQEPSVFRRLSVEKNLLCVLESLPLSKKERFELLESLLDEFELTKLREKVAESLSGGERRRLEIARALARKPCCLLLDEPFANVDPLTIQELKGMIRELNKKGIAILITDHNAREIFSIAKRCTLVQDGCSKLSGNTSELIANDYVRTTYLGSQFTM